MRVDTDDLVGITEMARALGVKPNVVGNWVKRYPTFPPPIITLSCGSLWKMSDVLAWRDPSKSFDVT